MKTLILGAGYAGLAVATKLKPTPGLEALLVEQNSFHTFETRLHEAAAHNTPVTLPLAPLLRGTGVHLEQAQVEGVNLDEREVTLKDGRVLTYDKLVVGLGSVTNFYRIPGLAENAAELKQLSDADEIFNFINRVYSGDYQGHRDIVVGGAGLTGVELVTELAQRSEVLSRERGLPPVQIYLVEAGPKILPVLDDALRAKAEKTLRDYGIHILVGHRITGATADSVTVQTAEGQQQVIPAGKIIWTGGIQARDIVKGEHLEKGPGGRIAVDEYLRAKNYPDVFVIGDMALALNQEGKPVPTTAQHAGQQGRLTGKNLMRLAKGEPLEPYEPSTLGEFVSLGGLMAVGWMKLPWNQKLAITGGLAHVMKRASEWRWRASIE
ncbi:NAD(P)/FAD-dependent oxidoreductase [Deinococcus metallilatus]|uniref:NAD(P)/FAD-dependent oxidoreductase n=2 Tax=Deinococcus TaxID=1298 RepID=A0AAJ5JYI2_9DEIO|nr:NAD(P)/FAD-dependent oxidoreductase [Deinococcus metallilatus]MBB5295534.1 NADH dehydrogenase [Deinococcus metallilatus]QBY07952.1 NAD(P)/FAD-dependent oxidoreductase [Deinococcus metallilatus]RXJ12845.1 NAD(P)/FAD-dependent oxidoreductase [Deinococcus metallilatus]TLK27233.1 NAD(P)/FAD-dependent oxidoreductase [Deinococcus metallilatus]GMA16212.1 NADH dehydrogenase [Deinococcus metallilatus]